MIITAPTFIRKAKSYTFGATVCIDHDTPLVLFHQFPLLDAPNTHYYAPPDAVESPVIQDAYSAFQEEQTHVVRSRMLSLAQPRRYKPPPFSDEVLRSIFLLSMQDGPVSTVLSLSWTCRRWRMLALSLPQLWTRISIVEDTQENLVELYLSRSQSLPLEINIDCPFNPDPGALEAVYGESGRWSKARVAITVGSIGMMDTYVEGNTGMLQELQLDFYGDDGQPTREHPTCRAFANASNLRTLKFSRSLSSERIDIPWWRLDDVEFTSSYNEPELFAMGELTFVFLPKTIRVNPNPSTDYHITQSRTFGHLSTFILNVWSTSIARQLDTLTLPDLKTLEFDFGDKLDEPSSADFTLSLERLLLRSELNEKLQRLKLGGNFTERHLLCALHATPRLEELVLRETDVLGAYMLTHDVMELLTLPSGILPMLRKIEFVWSPHSMGDGQEWAPPMIHSRLIRHNLEYEGGQSNLLEEVGLGVRGGGELDDYLANYAGELKDVPGVQVWLI